MKYAIAQISGKQFLLKPEQWYDIDFVKSSIIGDKILFNKILLLKKEGAIQLGQPFLKHSKIGAFVLRNVKSRKITVLKTKPKKKYTRTQGHRTVYTRVKISLMG
uniref:Ribosomal protein L21 n=1 Tax=Spumella sp. Baekdong012001B8 TaxID=2782410 RepID=A0A7S6PVE2_9STRA|nr:ribosomal protein L21 [Spumella sp. Baekdong012001B8]